MEAATEDLGWMARALGLAERARYRSRPNPFVGCVVVRDGHVVGEGWTDRAGGPHAEVTALRHAGDRARGATAYVTLEPCNHVGRTGPCSTALVDAGIARLVYGLRDPNPQAAGGADRVAAGGAHVEGGLLAAWVAEQNHVFLHGVRHGRPFVTLKLAQTRDGALVRPDRRWITGPAARRAVHRARARADAVMVGSGTVLADDPRLDVRDASVPGGQPRPVVLDARGRSPVGANVMRPGAIVVTSATSDAGWRTALAAAGVDVAQVAPGERGVDLPEAMAALWDRGVRAVLAEPGATLAAALVAAGLVDRIVRHVAPDAAIADAPPRPAAPLQSVAAWPVRGWARWGTDLEITTEPPDREAC